MSDPAWKDGWSGQVTWETRIGDRRLTVVAQPFLKRKLGVHRWAGIAVEAPAEAETLSEVLARHSHGDIGDYETLGECIVACEAYIETWTAGKLREVLCECTEIAEKESAPEVGTFSGEFGG